MSGFKITKSNTLAGTIVLEGTEDFVRVPATQAYLDIGELHHYYPTEYANILRELQAGYRVKDSGWRPKVIDVFLDYILAGWEMSYLGKARMCVYVPHIADRNKLISELQCVISLMEKPITISNVGTKQLSINTQVFIRQPDKKAPKICHEFEQVRPLVLASLAAWKSKRDEAVRI